jgi:hypothetical protein
MYLQVEPKRYARYASRKCCAFRCVNTNLNQTLFTFPPTKKVLKDGNIVDIQENVERYYKNNN